MYLTSLVSSTVGTYNQISYTPEPMDIISAVANNNEVLMADYIFDGDILATSIPAGRWAFHYHRKLVIQLYNSHIRFEIFSRTSGWVNCIVFTYKSFNRKYSI